MIKRTTGAETAQLWYYHSVRDNSKRERLVTTHQTAPTIYKVPTAVTGLACDQVALCGWHHCLLATKAIAAGFPALNTILGRALGSKCFACSDGDLPAVIA